MLTPGLNSQSAYQVAVNYVRRGWRVVPVRFRTKAPVIDGWQNLRITDADLLCYFSTRTNVGVLLGEPSGWLIDVDLDHSLAVTLAAAFLPSTGAIFGRASKRRSHWLYYAAGPVETRKWQLPGRKMVVELRSTGGQTVFPGSTHASGEPIEWDAAGEPAIVDPLELESALERLYHAVASQVAIPNPQSPARPPITAQAPHHIVERARRYLAKLPPAISGQGGHDATFHAACTLVIGFGLERYQALAQLRDWNESHCQPPWTERELEHKVDDAMKQPGWRGYLLAKSDRRKVSAPASAIERANRHAIEHRRRARRRAHA